MAGVGIGGAIGKGVAYVTGNVCAPAFGAVGGGAVGVVGGALFGRAYEGTGNMTSNVDCVYCANEGSPIWTPIVKETWAETSSSGRWENGRSLVIFAPFVPTSPVAPGSASQGDIDQGKE